MIYVIKSVPTVAACLAQLLRETSALPEDLALHYLHQTLGALEHLHRRQIVHLDVKGSFVSVKLTSVVLRLWNVRCCHFAQFSTNLRHLAAR